MKQVICILCSTATCLSLIVLVVFGSIWFGIFFGINYSEIVIKNTYRRVECNVTNHTQILYTCCKTACMCQFCSGEKCSDVPENLRVPGFSTGCCGGSACCRHCSSCRRVGKSTSCTSYCCSSVPSQYCTMRCYQCYKAQTTVEFLLLNSNSTIQTSITRDCDTSESCVDRYFAGHQINSTHDCFYDPGNPMKAKFDINFTKRKIRVLIAFTVFFALSILLVVLNFLGLGGFGCYWKFC
jgi:hypothetical protein